MRDQTVAAPSGLRANDRYERRRHAIVAAATGLLNIDGVRGMRLADVAAGLGLTTTSVTYYYPRKEDLAVACFEAGIAVFEAIADDAAKAGDPQTRIRRFLHLHLEMRSAARAGLRPPIPIFSDIRSLKEPAHGRMIRAFTAMLDKVAGLFDAPGCEWMGPEGRLARAQVLLEQMLWAVAWLPRYARDDYARVEERMAEVLLNGLAAPGQDWDPRPLWRQPAVLADRSGQDMFLRAATRLINDRGYRGASVSDIAAELNLTKGSFYHHHQGKDDLVVACFRRSIDFVRGVQRRVRDVSDNHWIQLSTATVALVEHQLSENGPLLRATALSALPFEIRQDVVRRFGQVTDHFAAMISDGVAEGSIRAVDPAIAAQMLTATIDAASDLQMLLKPTMAAGDLADLYARPLLVGLLTR